MGKIRAEQGAREYMWLDKPYKITKEVIERATGFNGTKTDLTIKKYKPAEVVELTGCHQDGRMCSLNDIIVEKV